MVTRETPVGRPNKCYETPVQNIRIVDGSDSDFSIQEVNEKHDETQVEEGQQPCCSKMLGPPEWLCDNEELLGKASLIVNNDLGSIDPLNAKHNPTNIHNMFRVANADSKTKDSNKLQPNVNSMNMNVSATQSSRKGRQVFYKNKKMAKKWEKRRQKAKKKAEKAISKIAEEESKKLAKQEKKEFKRLQILKKQEKMKSTKEERTLKEQGECNETNYKAKNLKFILKQKQHVLTRKLASMKGKLVKLKSKDSNVNDSDDLEENREMLSKMKEHLEKLKAEEKRENKHHKQDNKMKKKTLKEEKVKERKNEKLVRKAEKLKLKQENLETKQKENDLRNQGEDISKLKTKKSNDQKALRKHLLKMQKLQDQIETQKNAMEIKNFKRNKKAKLAEIKKAKKDKEQAHQQEIKRVESIKKEENKTKLEDLKKELERRSEEQNLLLLQDKENKNKLKELQVKQTEDNRRAKQQKKKLQKLEKQKLQMQELEKNQQLEEEQIAFAKNKIRKDLKKIVIEKEKQDLEMTKMKTKILKLEKQKAKNARTMIENLQRDGKIVVPEEEKQRIKQLEQLKKEREHIAAEVKQMENETELLHSQVAQSQEQELIKLIEDGKINQWKLEYQSQDTIKKIQTLKMQDERDIVSFQETLEKLKRDEEQLQKNKAGKSDSWGSICHKINAITDTIAHVKKELHQKKKDAKIKQKKIEEIEKNQANIVKMEFDRLKKEEKIKEPKVYIDLKNRAKERKENLEKMQKQLEIKEREIMQLQMRRDKETELLAVQLQDEGKMEVTEHCKNSNQQLQKLRQMQEEFDKNREALETKMFKLTEEETRIKKQELDFKCTRKEIKRQMEEMKIANDRLEELDRIRNARRIEIDQCDNDCLNMENRIRCGKDKQQQIINELSLVKRTSEEEEENDDESFDDTMSFCNISASGYSVTSNDKLLDKNISNVMRKAAFAKPQIDDNYKNDHIVKKKITETKINIAENDKLPELLPRIAETEDKVISEVDNIKENGSKYLKNIVNSYRNKPFKALREGMEREHEDRLSKEDYAEQLNLLMKQTGLQRKGLKETARLPDVHRRPSHEELSLGKNPKIKEQNFLVKQKRKEMMLKRKLATQKLRLDKKLKRQNERQRKFILRKIAKEAKLQQKEEAKKRRNKIASVFDAVQDMFGTKENAAKEATNFLSQIVKVKQQTNSELKNQQCDIKNTGTYCKTFLKHAAPINETDQQSGTTNATLKSLKKKVSKEEKRYKLDAFDDQANEMRFEKYKQSIIALMKETSSLKYQLRLSVSFTEYEKCRLKIKRLSKIVLKLNSEKLQIEKSINEIITEKENLMIEKKFEVDQKEYLRLECQHNEEQLKVLQNQYDILYKELSMSSEKNLKEQRRILFEYSDKMQTGEYSKSLVINDLRSRMVKLETIIKEKELELTKVAQLELREREVNYMMDKVRREMDYFSKLNEKKARNQQSYFESFTEKQKNGQQRQLKELQKTNNINKGNIQLAKMETVEMSKKLENALFQLQEREKLVKFLVEEQRQGACKQCKNNERLMKRLKGTPQSRTLINRLKEEIAILKIENSVQKELNMKQNEHIKQVVDLKSNYKKNLEKISSRFIAFTKSVNFLISRITKDKNARNKFFLENIDDNFVKELEGMIFQATKDLRSKFIKNTRNNHENKLKKNIIQIEPSGETNNYQSRESQYSRQNVADNAQSSHRKYLVAVGTQTNCQMAPQEKLLQKIKLLEKNEKSLREKIKLLEGKNELYMKSCHMHQDQYNSFKVNTQINSACNVKELDTLDQGFHHDAIGLCERNNNNKLDKFFTEEEISTVPEYEVNANHDTPNKTELEIGIEEIKHSKEDDTMDESMRNDKEIIESNDSNKNSGDEDIVDESVRSNKKTTESNDNTKNSKDGNSVDQGDDKDIIQSNNSTKHIEEKDTVDESVTNDKKMIQSNESVIHVVAKRKAKSDYKPLCLDQRDENKIEIMENANTGNPDNNSRLDFSNTTTSEPKPVKKTKPLWMQELQLDYKKIEERKQDETVVGNKVDTDSFALQPSEKDNEKYPVFPISKPINAKGEQNLKSTDKAKEQYKYNVKLDFEKCNLPVSSSTCKSEVTKTGDFLSELLDITRKPRKKETEFDKDFPRSNSPAQILPSNQNLKIKETIISQSDAERKSSKKNDSEIFKCDQESQALVNRAGPSRRSFITSEEEPFSSEELVKDTGNLSKHKQRYNIFEDEALVVKKPPATRRQSGQCDNLREIQELKNISEDKPGRKYYPGIEFEREQTKEELELVAKIMREPLPDPFKDLKYKFSRNST